MTPVGIVPDGASVFYDPFGVYAFSRNELVAMAVAVVAMVAPAARCSGTAPSACGCGPSSRARG